MRAIVQMIGRSECQKGFAANIGREEAVDDNLAMLASYVESIRSAL